MPKKINPKVKERCVCRLLDHLVGVPVADCGGRGRDRGGVLPPSLGHGHPGQREMLERVGRVGPQYAGEHLPLSGPAPARGAGCRPSR